MKENFLISTGGSGGHVTPAIILHDHLSKHANVVFSVDKRGLKYVDKNLFTIEIINTPKLNNIFFFPFNIIFFFFLFIKSLFLLKKRKINKIISTGGYMSLPIVIAGKLLNMNIYLIEPNHVLGRANKFYLRFCKKIFCYTNQIKNFPHNFLYKRIIINPLVKEKVYKLKESNKNHKKFNILIVGGSQSANIFNQQLKEKVVKLSKKKSIRVFQQTNEKNISYLEEFYSKNKIESEIFSFKKNLEKVMQITDLCITRAGASTLAELSVMNIPFIAVPLPKSKDNHQFENAKYYKEKGCCWIIEQDTFEEKIEDLLNNIIKDNKDYLKKKENLKKINYQNTWINVNGKILKIINEN